MPKLPRTSGAAIVKALERLGFVKVRQSGSHVIMRRGTKGCVVPMHSEVKTFTAVVKNDGEWWIGWVEEVPGVNCQERSRDELLKTLRVTLMEALKMNRADARDAGGKGYEELSIVV
jgi:predicted RNA binding protein YcfA (HicA-like mRNA interferase family)